MPHDGASKQLGHINGVAQCTDAAAAAGLAALPQDEVFLDALDNASTEGDSKQTAPVAAGSDAEPTGQPAAAALMLPASSPRSRQTSSETRVMDVEPLQPLFKAPDPEAASASRASNPLSALGAVAPISGNSAVPTFDQQSESMMPRSPQQGTQVLSSQAACFEAAFAFDPGSSSSSSCNSSVYSRQSTGSVSYLSNRPSGPNAHFTNAYLANNAQHYASSTQQAPFNVLQASVQGVQSAPLCPPVQGMSALDVRHDAVGRAPLPHFQSSGPLYSQTSAPSHSHAAMPAYGRVPETHPARPKEQVNGAVATPRLYGPQNSSAALLAYNGEHSSAMTADQTQQGQPPLDLPGRELKLDAGRSGTPIQAHLVSPQPRPSPEHGQQQLQRNVSAIRRAQRIRGHMQGGHPAASDNSDSDSITSGTSYQSAGSHPWQYY